MPHGMMGEGGGPLFTGLAQHRVDAPRRRQKVPEKQGFMIQNLWPGIRAYLRYAHTIPQPPAFWHFFPATSSGTGVLKRQDL